MISKLLKSSNTNISIPYMMSPNMISKPHLEHTEHTGKVLNLLRNIRHNLPMTTIDIPTRNIYDHNFPPPVKGFTL